ncbi:hypothetical protein [Mycolicibacterium mageritense]|uniref:hypothetical protein n=1 Tax=Mycolicibacterium mageritense TaxID=53462 RepID=UPI0011D5D0F8|nr:hypothetical protein [Mycolicibacterium mageritense]TXI53150.1 MAG: hypothetical protein E6Q55_35720 [Mycolicibacterium mageritense]
MIRDSGGIEILATDSVMVTAWGDGTRLIDTGIKRPVIRLNRQRVVILDADGQERAMRGSVLSVLRRDGEPGFEHNRP